MITDIKMLVLDDEVEVLGLICSTLEKLGLEVMAECVNEYAVTEALKMKTNDINFCLLDIALGKSMYEGIKVAKRILDKHPNMCIAFISAHAENADIFRDALGVQPVQVFNKGIFMQKESNNVVFTHEITFKNDIVTAWQNHQRIIKERNDANKTTNFYESGKDSENNVQVFIKPIGTSGKQITSREPLFLADILYIENDGEGIIKIHIWRDGKHEIKRLDFTLDGFIDKCTQDYKYKNLIRVHRSYAFNFVATRMYKVGTETIEDLEKSVYETTFLPIGAKFKQMVNEHTKF